MEEPSKQSYILARLTEFNLIDDLYEALQRPDAFKRLASGLSGWHWEDEVAAYCDKNDIEWKPAPSKTLPYELTVRGKKVQCKATSLTDRIDIRSHANPRRYHADAFDVLCLKIIRPDCRLFYFIPANKLVDPKKPSVMRGGIKLTDYAQYLDAWNLLNSDPQSADTQCSKIQNQVTIHEANYCWQESPLSLLRTERHSQHEEVQAPPVHSLCA